MKKFFILIILLLIISCITNIGVHNNVVSNKVEVVSYEDNIVSNSPSNDDNIEYLNDEMFVKFDDATNREINNFTAKYYIENIQENYLIERHFFILEGTGNNDKWGNIEIDWNFEYPQIRYNDNKEKEDKINSFITETIFLYFVLSESESKEYISYDPFKGYTNLQSSRYEITYADNNYISIHYTTHISEGIGSGITENSGLTIEITKAEILQLFDLISKKDIVKYIQENKYELLSETNGIGNISQYNEGVKNEIIKYLDVYTKEFEHNNSLDKSLFYFDNEYLYICIYEINSYNQNILLKIPFEIY